MQQRQPDLYTRITSRIVAELEQGVRPWLKPWGATSGSPVTRPLRHNGEPYRGINVLTLWGEAMTKGYASSTWMTYRQAAEFGAQVRKGEHGSLVVFADRFTRTETSDNGEDVERHIPFLKGYIVFNCEQIDGLPERYLSAARSAATQPVARDAAAEAFFAATGAEIRHGGDRAYYAPGPDFIQMPPFQAFRDAESYFETLGHECIHWTSHRSRLDRSFGQKRWGDEAYAVEELVAELGSAFLCADLGLSPEPRPDHASYIASWLTVLKNDKRAIFSAAAHAERATAFLHGLQSKRVPLLSEKDAA